MKKATSIFMATLLLGIGMLQSSCMGSWSITKKLYKFNESVTGNKFVNNILFWLFTGVGVYGVTIFIDYVILNTIEFWTGSNPVAMKEGEMEKQIVQGKDGNKYELTATKNRMDMVQLTGEKAGFTQSLLFSPETQSCSIVVNGETRKLLQYNENTNILELFSSNGEVTTVYAPVNGEVMFALNK